MKSWEIRMRNNVDDNEQNVYDEDDVKKLLEEITNLRAVVEAQDVIIRHLRREIMTETCIHCGKSLDDD